MKSEYKYCAKCEQDKPIDDFNKNKTRHDGLQGWCRECQHSKNGETKNNRKHGQIIEKGQNKYLVRIYVGTENDGKRKYYSELVRGGLEKAESRITELTNKKDMGWYKTDLEYNTYKMSAEDFDKEIYQLRQVIENQKEVIEELTSSDTDCDRCPYYALFLAERNKLDAYLECRARGEKHKKTPYWVNRDGTVELEKTQTQ